MKNLTTVSLSKKEPALRQPSLLLCVVLDLVGYASYSIPIIGELADVFWAPVSGLLFFSLFGGWKGAMGGLFSFIEELLPGTDFIPSFTLMWLIRHGQQQKRAL